MDRRAFLLVSAVVTASCATGEGLKTDARRIATKLEQARLANAYQCAPSALASAETHLEFLLLELDQGNAIRAGEHRRAARKAMLATIDGVRACQRAASSAGDADSDGVPDEFDRCPGEAGLLGLAGCPDRDGDGLPDQEDDCPGLTGSVALQGCPDLDGDGIADGKDACPARAEDFDGDADEDGCPDETDDPDGDGLLEDEDRCPQQAEDQDGFEDSDGCPDADNDGDGMPDDVDVCPLEAETPNGFEDDDGCPDEKLDLVEVKRDVGKIEIKQRVYFDSGRNVIKPVSYRLLNQVAQVLIEASTMKVVIEGHTDARGAREVNRRLSQDRADAVRTYLVAQGVEPERLAAIGFGEDKPVTTNRTREGRERNRRVEFTITEE